MGTEAGSGSRSGLVLGSRQGYRRVRVRVRVRVRIRVKVRVRVRV